MSPSDADALADFPVKLVLPVQWGDQDAFGHVNNTVYFRWFESARIEYLHHPAVAEWLSADGPERERSGTGHGRLGPILAAIRCNFRQQVTFPDCVTIGARVARLGRTSFVMEHAVISVGQRGIVADGDSTIVVYDYAHDRPHPIPDPMRRALESIEGRQL
jgi:acyl-CoA thioester hydrolase